MNNLTEHALKLFEALTIWVRKHQLVLKIICSLIFLAACSWAFLQLGVRPVDMQLQPFVVLFFLLSPFSLIYGGFGLIMLAHASGATMSLGFAMRISAWAQLAEALPLPGGAMVRTGALMKAGVSTKRSAWLVIITAILWISLAAMFSGAVIYLQGHDLGLLLGLSAGILSIASLAWIVVDAGWFQMFLTLLHRLLGLLLMALRLKMAFGILGHDVELASTIPFALASIAGSASSIAPAGLGVSEVLAAMMAGSVALAPALALLAVAFNRLIALASSAACLLLWESPKLLCRRKIYG
ncbi:hypothetical protein [uncultured Sphingorhabdus sp.]|uniref:hypothetical protein n=1 Tax=uncultured Sphingorhabdus sp. TaxID=1686106 RepID=UPI0026041128|nr:hypothetical protein [uncultured Sphingorhabdus sp.]HMS19167.1 hypothetical protein [Sphingorhabdus sp.]